MLSLFPQLLSWSQISPFLIRIALGVVFVYWAYVEFRHNKRNAYWKLLGLVELATGVLLVIGLWAQLAAAVAAIDLIIRLIERATKRAFLTDGVNYYLLLLIMALSILVTGAGLWGFDFSL